MPPDARHAGSMCIGRACRFEASTATVSARRSLGVNHSGESESESLPQLTNRKDLHGAADLLNDTRAWGIIESANVGGRPNVDKS